MAKTGEGMPDRTLLPTAMLQGESSVPTSTQIEAPEETTTCGRVSSCCGAGARTTGQKISGVLLFLALVVVILARIFGVI